MQYKDSSFGNCHLLHTTQLSNSQFNSGIPKCKDVAKFFKNWQ